MLVKIIVLHITLFLSGPIHAIGTEYWIKQGDLAFNKQQIEESIVNYSRAIEERPKQPLGYIKRAMAYRASGQYIKASEDMQRAIQIDPLYTKSYLKTRPDIR